MCTKSNVSLPSYDTTEMHDKPVKTFRQAKDLIALGLGVKGRGLGQPLDERLAQVLLQPQQDRLES